MATSSLIRAEEVPQAANLVFATPDGAAGLPDYRALVGADMPASNGRIAQLSIGGAALHAAVLSWQNPTGAAIIIDRVELDVTTVSTGACTVDVGTTATSATTASDNLIDGKDVNAAAGVFDNLGSAGTNGKAVQKLAAGKWVTIDEATGDATGLVAKLNIFYHLA